MKEFLMRRDNYREANKKEAKSRKNARNHRWVTNNRNISLKNNTKNLGKRERVYHLLNLNNRKVKLKQRNYRKIIKTNQTLCQ
jgi:hypothetical protein